MLHALSVQQAKIHASEQQRVHSKRRKSSPYMYDPRRRRLPDSHLLSCRTRVSGALETCLMESMTGTVAGLGCVPRSSQGELCGHALSFFSDRVSS